jgi:hypothetical protein
LFCGSSSRSAVSSAVCPMLLYYSVTGRGNWN